jgi:hypothetical protein
MPPQRPGQEAESGLHGALRDAGHHEQHGARAVGADRHLVLLGPVLRRRHHGADGRQPGRVQEDPPPGALQGQRRLQLGGVRHRGPHGKPLVRLQPAPPRRPAPDHRGRLRRQQLRVRAQAHAQRGRVPLTAPPRHRGRQRVPVRPPPPHRQPLHLRQPQLHHPRLHHQHSGEEISHHPRGAAQLPLRGVVRDAAAGAINRIRHRRGAHLRRRTGGRLHEQERGNLACVANVRADGRDRRGANLGHGDDAHAAQHGRHGDPAHGRRADHQRRGERLPGLGPGLGRRAHARHVRHQQPRGPVPDARRDHHPARLPLHRQPALRRPHPRGREQHPRVLRPHHHPVPHRAPRRSLLATVPGSNQRQHPPHERVRAGHYSVRAHVRGLVRGAEGAGRAGGEPAQLPVRDALVLAGAAHAQAPGIDPHRGQGRRVLRHRHGSPDQPGGSRELLHAVRRAGRRPRQGRLGAPQIAPCTFLMESCRTRS